MSDKHPIRDAATKVWNVGRLLAIYLGLSK